MTLHFGFDVPQVLFESSTALVLSVLDHRDVRFVDCRNYVGFDVDAGLSLVNTEFRAENRYLLDNSTRWWRFASFS
jgi:hypothetical protein